MGPLRGGLTLALSFTGTGALAQACETLRPDWEGAPVTLWQEALYLFSTPPALVLILASLIVIRLRHAWGALIVVVLWSLLTTLISMADPTGLQNLARAEGCMGSPALFIVIVAAICVGMILYTAPRKERPDRPE